jgi:hypothetical protein
LGLLKSLSVEHETAISSNRTPYVIDEFEKRGELNLRMELGSVNVDFMYNESRIRSMYGRGGGTNQFRFIGLETEGGFTYKRTIDLYMRHFSGHSLDDNLGRDYPQDNSIGLRVKLYER